LMGEEERQEVLRWSSGGQGQMVERCIHELFEEQVEKNGDGIAVVWEGRQLSYRELNEKANQLAHYLSGLGVGAEVLVGLCLERSLELVVGVLGILKAGGAYLPLDPNYPKERLEYIINDAHAGILLTQSTLRERLTFPALTLVCLDGQWPEI